jgi:hypothetical protein
VLGGTHSHGVPRLLVEQSQMPPNAKAQPLAELAACEGLSQALPLLT